MRATDLRSTLYINNKLVHRKFIRNFIISLQMLTVKLTILRVWFFQ
jgi:hypothetical protein